LLQPHTHTLITVPNDRLLQVAPRDVSLEVAFRLADDVLRQGVQAVSELITHAGLINVDFAHVRSLMERGGGALMAVGVAEGPDKARDAIHQALHHPLLGVDNLEYANGALVHFTGGEDLTLFEVSEAVDELRASLAPDTDIILGATTEPSMEGRTQVILIVTGIGGRPMPASAEHVPPSASLAAAPAAEDDLDLPTFLRRRVAVGS